MCDKYYTNYGKYIDICVTILGNEILSGIDRKDAYMNFLESIKNYKDIKQDIDKASKLGSLRHLNLEHPTKVH